MPSIINSDSGAVTGSAGLKFAGSDDGILEIQNDGQTSLVISNQYIKLPSGNTASRPVTATVGMLRFNNESNAFEAFIGNIWNNVSRASRSLEVRYLVVAGGGSGGSRHGAGGGAGGFRTANNFLANTDSPYNITIGAGGASTWAGTAESAVSGLSGSPSNFAGVVSTGGGSTGGTGGSGGGGFAAGGAGGSGIPGQGNPGGQGFVTPSFPTLAHYSGGGGGGAGAAGGTGILGRGGNGGNGAVSNITGTNVTYAGGGGGGSGHPGTSSTGGTGGGGIGTGPGAVDGTSGNVNLGGGGGGGGFAPPNTLNARGGAGGSGVVILRYPTEFSLINNAGGLTISTVQVGNSFVSTFTAGTGNIEWR